MISLRTASQDDAQAVLDFWSTSAEDSHRPPDSREAIVAVIDKDPEALILAFDGDLLVGTIIAGWDGWRCHIYRLAVASSHRRQGLGRALISAAETRLRGSGATRVDAMVLDENDLGVAAWSASGYSRQDNWSRWVKAL